LSAPHTANTLFAKSIPIVVTSIADPPRGFECHATFLAHCEAANKRARVHTIIPKLFFEESRTFVRTEPGPGFCLSATWKSKGRRGKDPGFLNTKFRNDTEAVTLPVFVRINYPNDYGGIRNSIRALVVVTAPTSSRLNLRTRAIASTVSTTIEGSVGHPSNGPPNGHGPSVSTSIRPSGTIRASRMSRSRYATSGVSEMK